MPRRPQDLSFSPVLLPVDRGWPATSLPAVLAAYAAGIALSALLSPSPFFLFLPPSFALLSLLLRRTRVGAPALLAFVLTTGLCLAQLQETPPSRPDHIAAFVSEDPTTVEGRVLSTSRRPEGRWIVDLEELQVVRRDRAAPVAGRMRLTVKGEPAFGAGDRVRFRARLKSPRPFGTPGEFNFPRHLAARGIHVTAFVADVRDIVVFASEGSGTGRLERWREAVARIIDGSVVPQTAPLVRALSIGDSGAIPPAQRDLLAWGGVSHLFAISGLHLGLVALFFFAGARALYRRSETLLLFSPPSRSLPPFLLAPLLIYVLLTGSALPTRRAFLALLGGAVLLLAGRRTPPLRLLAAVAFVLLLAQPLALFEPSFQLSFAGVLGILVWVPRWSRPLERFPAPLRYTVQLLLTTAAATLTTTPFVLFHFHLIAPAGLLTNLAAVPLIGFGAVPLGLAGALLAPLFPEGAELLFRSCAWILQSVLAGVEGVIRLPGLEGWKFYPSPAQSAGLLGAVFALLLPAGTWKRRLARGGIAAAALALVLIPLPSSPGLTVTALSVGQGDATLLSRPGGRHYLIDGGGLYGSDFDTGERLVAPALGRLGVRALEAVILTHDHPDHSRGLVHILKVFPVRAFWSPMPLSELNAELRELLVSRRIPTVVFTPGWHVLEEGENALSLYAPAQSARLNDTSLVLYARQGSDGVLLTGDLEFAGVSELLQAEPVPGPVTLLKLPHHGSRHSRPELLADRYAPLLAFASAGAGNIYRLPHEEVRRDMAARGIPLHSTSEAGTLRFSSTGAGWQVERWERGVFR